MSRRICSPIVAAWLACLTILLLVSSATGLFLPPESDFERHALAELDIFDANDSSATRLVILGDSLMRNATRQTPTFSDRLTTAGLDVAIVNLAASDRRFSSYRNILDDVLATRPDVIVIQPDLLRGGGPEHEFSIQRRLRTLFPGGTDYSAPYCRSRPRYLPSLISDIPRRVAPSNDAFDDALAFFTEAESLGVEIFLLSVPRSTSAEVPTSAHTEAFRQRVQEALGDRSNLTIGPSLTVGDSEFYCDFAHLNPAGQQLFLDQLIPKFGAYLETLNTK